MAMMSGDEYVVSEVSSDFSNADESVQDRESDESVQDGESDESVHDGLNSYPKSVALKSSSAHSETRPMVSSAEGKPRAHKKKPNLPRGHKDQKRGGICPRCHEWRGDIKRHLAGKYACKGAPNAKTARPRKRCGLCEKANFVQRYTQHLRKFHGISDKDVIERLVKDERAQRTGTIANRIVSSTSPVSVFGTFNDRIGIDCVRFSEYATSSSGGEKTTAQAKQMLQQVSRIFEETEEQRKTKGRASSSLSADGILPTSQS